MREFLSDLVGGLLFLAILALTAFCVLGVLWGLVVLMIQG